MRKIFLAMIAALGFSSGFSQTGEKNFIDQNYIEVTGKSEMEITPDLIYISISIQEKDNSGKTPLPELEKKMKEKLTEMGIDVSKDLRVKDIESDFKKYYFFKPDVMLSKDYQLLVHDGGTAGKVFVELKKLNISNISIEKLDHSKMEEFKKQVKVNAVKAAKTKAELLTQAIFQNCGRALYIQEMDYGDYVPMPMMMNRKVSYEMMDSAGQSNEEPAIEFQKLKLNASVLVRFELK